MAHPIDIREVGNQELLITWDDEHRSLYSNAYLRWRCPCARCVDEWTGKRVVEFDKIPADLQRIRMSPVGRYALQFEWGDGHGTGIYGFDYLKKICPCPSCAG